MYFIHLRGLANKCKTWVVEFWNIVGGQIEDVCYYYQCKEYRHTYVERDTDRDVRT